MLRFKLNLNQPFQNILPYGAVHIVVFSNRFTILLRSGEKTLDDETMIRINQLEYI